MGRFLERSRDVEKCVRWGRWDMGKRYRTFCSDAWHYCCICDVIVLLLCCYCAAIVLPLCCHVGKLFFPSCVVTMRCKCMFMVEGEGKMHVGIMYLR